MPIMNKPQRLLLGIAFLACLTSYANGQRAALNNQGGSLRDYSLWRRLTHDSNWSASSTMRRRASSYKATSQCRRIATRKEVVRSGSA